MAIWLPVRAPLHVVRNTETEFSDNSWVFIVTEQFVSSGGNLGSLLTYPGWHGMRRITRPIARPGLYCPIWGIRKVSASTESLLAESVRCLHRQETSRSNNRLECG